MSPALRMPEIGETLAGKYRLEGALGEGGMGIVFRAEHLKLARKVAIKMLLPDALGDAEMVTRLQREARAAGQLESVHVAHVLDVDETPEGIPYIVMELLEGHDLEHELVSRGRLPVREAVQWLLQACEAMVEAHGRGIVHRDLKPSNLFLARGRGGQRVLKILDFGISKVQSENVKLTLADRPMGTPLYMSPEQVRSAAVAGPASDQWALGVILYELVTGAPPFMGETVSAVSAAVVVDEPPPFAKYVGDVPDAVQAAVRRALAKDPGARFPDVASFAQAIAPFAPTVSIVPPSERVSQATARTLVVHARTGPTVETSAGTTTSASPPRRRSRTRERAALAAAAIALLATAAGIVTWSRGRAGVSPTATTGAAPSVTAPVAASAPAPSVAAEPEGTPVVPGSVSPPGPPSSPPVIPEVSSARNRPRPHALPASATSTASPATTAPAPPKPATPVPVPVRDNPERL